jgi:HEAT repeat protein
MSTAPALSPDLIRQSIALARTLSAAARNWSLYPPEHPAVDASVKRLAEAVRHSTSGAAFSFGVTPKTLLVAGIPLPEEQPVAETAKLLHDHDLLAITFLADPPVEALHALLRLLSIPGDELRAAGGPAPAWDASGHATIVLEQIDYEKLLEDRDIETPLENRHDDVWRSLVNTFAQGGNVFDPAQQARLLEISNSVFEIGDLASATADTKRNLDGSPLVTTQAATVLAVFRHLANLVNVMEPERLPDVLRNVASASTMLDPHVVLNLMQTDDTTNESPVVQAIAKSFDDEKVAELLATALARDGRATERLAQVFDTIAPDDERKHRVLKMTRSMLSEQDFGKSGQFRAVWASMEELLLSYDESPYVSAAYQASLQGAAERGEMLAARDLPAELPEWVDTLGQDNVRSLSVQLIVDLLTIEDNAERAAEITTDMTALLEDLFLAGDFDNAVVVLRELKKASAKKIAQAAARAALTSCGESPGLLDAASLVGELDEHGLKVLAECFNLIGPAGVRAMLPTLQSERETAAYTRACDIVRRYGAPAIGHLSPLTEDNRWFVQRTAAMLLGATRSPDAIAPLQALLRRNDLRVRQQAVRALAGIDDPAAARAIQTVLRAATGEHRAAVVEALVSERDPRVVPMLSRILAESDPFGADLQTVLDALEAVRQLANEQAVPEVASLMKKKKFFARKKARAFKTASVQALVAIGTPKAKSALAEASRTGDRLLKKIIKEHGAQP